ARRHTPVVGSSVNLCSVWIHTTSPSSAGKTRSTRHGDTSCSIQVTLINRAVTPASRGMSLTPRSGGPSSFSSSAYSLSVWVSAADSPLGGETSSTLVGPPAAAGDAPHISSAAHTVTTPSPDVSRRNPPFHHSRIRTPTRPADPRAARPRAACHFWYTARAAGVPTEPRRESASYRATELQSNKATELQSCRAGDPGPGPERSVVPRPVPRAVPRPARLQ